jgi:hypothetical protein
MTRTVPRKWLSLAFLVGGILLTASVDARAGLQLTLTQGAATTTFTTPTPGTAGSFAVSIGDYTIDVVAAASNSPGVTDARLSISTLNITRNTATFADPLFISASATDYAVPPSNGIFSASYTTNFAASTAGDSTRPSTRATTT